MKNHNLLNKFTLILFSAFLLSACSSWIGEDEAPPLPGERISVLELQNQLEPSDLNYTETGFLVDDAWPNRFWPQNGGYPNHAMHHLALSSGNELKRKWSVSIGAGNKDDLPLTAQPIVIDGIIYTLDSKSKLSAFSTDKGKKLWSKTFASEKKDDLVSGGLGFGAGYIFATTGRTQVYAIEPKTGDIIWQKKLVSPARAAPTVLDNKVYIQTMDNSLEVLKGDDGSSLWQHQGLAETAQLLGSPNPAASGDLVVIGYSSGEVFGLRAESGATLWTDNLTSVRRALSISKISDIRALPVIDRDIVFAASYGGRMVAIDARTGTRIWQREISTSETPWVAGNAVFIITAENQMIALSRETGAYIWVTPLRRFKDETDRVNAIAWTNPILANDRLYSFNTLGEAIEVSPETGAIIREWKVGSPVSISPVIAEGMMFVLGDNGKLSAYQ